MNELEKTKSATETDLLQPSTSSPLVFISHDSRDAELAEAFAKLLKSVSAGMIKTFRSSDKKGTEGINFGEEWYKRLMSQLQTTSDVVCLFTERSLDRPWILFEAGVAKGKLNTPVIGIALGVPLSRVTSGPFYQFQNMDDGEEELTKLVHQFARRVPNLEVDHDVLKAQVLAFKAAESEILKRLASGRAKSETRHEMEESAVAKLAEELKSLPSRIAERLAESEESPRRRRSRRYPPRMINELVRASGDRGDPIAILMAASFIRDDVPWLYELSLEMYRALKAGNAKEIQRQIKRIRKASELMMRGPFMEETGPGGEEQHIFAMEFPRMLEHMVMRTLDTRRSRLAAGAVPAQSALESEP
jgi:TIR domain